MKSLLEQLGIALFGLATTIVVVLVTRVLVRLIGFDLTGISINLIPVGAIVAGALAASGYYFGATYSQNKANLSLLIMMVVIAGFAEILGLWLDYVLTEVRGEPVRNLVSFAEYCSIVFESTGITIMGRRVGYRNIDHTGWFGYVLAARHFIGYLVGGIIVYVLLLSRKTCPSCNVYLKNMGADQRIFSDETSATEHVEAVVRDPADFVDKNRFSAEASEPVAPQPASVRVSATLLACPFCKHRVIRQEIGLYNGNEWKDITAVSSEFSARDTEGPSKALEQVNPNAAT